jgi:hypothetical protein
MSHGIIGRLLLTVSFIAGSGLFAKDAAGQAQPAPDTVREGPDILYAAPAKSPQLENTGVWKAEPILISGVSAYRNGEFLYQDYLYDDRGAAQRALYPEALKAKTGDNAADFVEVRVKPLEAETAFRITMQTMLDPDVVATTIAMGDGTKTAALPFGAGGTMPATIFVTVHGSTAVATDAATGNVIANGAKVSVDKARRQIEVRVPYSIFDPRNKSVRIAAGPGLWDSAKNAYAVPADPPAPPPPEPGAEVPRNQRPLPPLPVTRSYFFNVAFRYKEPMNVNSLLPFFSDVQQADVLRGGDLSAFFATVDFAKLASGADDNSQIPKKGYMSRILVSHFEPMQGRGPEGNMGKLCAAPCLPQYGNRLQPYTIYVPQKAQPANGYGLMIDLHSAAASYARWLGTIRHIQFGERGTGSIVVTPMGRGLRSGYMKEAAADPFEVWADVERMYKIDHDYVTLGGLSMGTGGSFKYAALFPDLFAGMALQVNCPNFMMDAHLYVPAAVMTGDKDVNTNCHPGNKLLDRYVASGQQIKWWNFLEHPHPFSTIPRDWAPFAEYLGMRKRVTDPPLVTYYYNVDQNELKYGINADHAYWVSAVKIRNANYKGPADPSLKPEEVAAAPAYGRVEVFSHGMGLGRPVANAPVKTSDSYYWAVPTYPWPNYNAEEVSWQPIPKNPVSDVLDIKAENIASLTIDPTRARISCNATVNVHSDGPIQVKIRGCTKPNIVMASR